MNLVVEVEERVFACVNIVQTTAHLPTFRFRKNQSLPSSNIPQSLQLFPSPPQPLPHKFPFGAFPKGP